MAKPNRTEELNGNEAISYLCPIKISPFCESVMFVAHLGFLPKLSFYSLSMFFFQGFLVLFCIFFVGIFPPLLSKPTIVKISQSSLTLLFISLPHMYENSFYFFPSHYSYFSKVASLVFVLLKLLCCLIVNF